MNDDGDGVGEGEDVAMSSTLQAAKVRGRVCLLCTASVCATTRARVLFARAPYSAPVQLQALLFRQSSLSHHRAAAAVDGPAAAAAAAAAVKSGFVPKSEGKRLQVTRVFHNMLPL